jgi:hypothetical protein
MSIVTAIAAQNYRAGKLGMPEFAMQAFAAGRQGKPALSKSETNWRIFRGIHKTQYHSASRQSTPASQQKNADSFRRPRLN